MKRRKIGVGTAGELLARTIQTAMITTHAARRLKTFPEGLTRSVETHSKIIQGDIELLGHVGWRFAL